MKSVLRSIKPYWLYLILIGKKTIEVGKDFPQAKDWDRTVNFYCSKDKKSFNRIPEKDREWMRKYLGKVACKFVCDKKDRIAHCGTRNNDISLRLVDENFYCKEIDCVYLNKCQLSYSEIDEYSNGRDVYGWHISNLVIYDKPKELREFYVPVKDHWETYDPNKYINGCWRKPLEKPPQSWCYVESGAQGGQALDWSDSE